MIKPQTNLTDLIQTHIREPGANRDSLRRFLIDEAELTPEDGGELAAAVCRKMTEERFPPITEMELMLTEECNHRCDYCFVEGKNPANPMNRETAEKAVDFLFERSREKPELKILFFGGEPMLAFELIKEIVLYVEEKIAGAGKKISFDMTTNGTLFDEERASFLAEHGVKCARVNKISQGRPHILDKLKDGQVQWIINTSSGSRTTEDSYSIRRAALDYHIPYTTTITGASSMTQAIATLARQEVEVKTVQEFSAAID